MCANCNAKESTSTCTQCQKERYCGRECQANAWKQHKKVCIPPRAVLPACAKCGGWGTNLLGDNGMCAACSAPPVAP